jgi:hypothetical protein
MSNASRPVSGRGDDPGVVRAESGREHFLVMTAQNGKAFPYRVVPYERGPIRGGGDDARAVMSKGGGQDGIGVAAEHGDFGSYG